MVDSPKIKWKTKQEIEDERNQPRPPTQAERIEELENENLQLKLALAEMAEDHETEKTEIKLALAELAELLTGGDE
jgi:hypothetical protein